MPTTSRLRPTRGWPTAVPRVRLLAALLVLVVVLAGCGGEEPAGQPASQPDPSQPPAEPVTIRMGWTTPGQEIFYVMQHLPEVAPNLGTWYEMEWNQMQPGQVARALGAASLDGAGVSTLPVGTAVDRGIDLVITGQFIGERDPHTPVTWLVRNDSGINTVADLEGKTVGTIAVDSFGDVIQDYHFSTEGGLEPGEDYQKVEIPFPQMQTALESGDIAIGLFAPPFLQQALATGQFKPMFDLLDVQPEWVVVVSTFRREFVEEHRAAIEKFVEDWATVAQWVADPANREQVIEATNQATHVPVEVLERYLLTEEDGYRPPNGALNQEVLQSNFDFFTERGALSTNIPVEDLVIEDLLPSPS